MTPRRSTIVFCAGLLLVMAASARARNVSSTSARRNPAIGYSFDPAIPGDNLTERIDAVNPLYVRSFVRWDQIEPVRGWRDWAATDRIINFNFARGRKLVLCIFPYPDWLAALPEDEWMQARSLFVSSVIARYRRKLYAIESCNEPCCARPDQKWGYIPGITNDTDSLRAKLIAIYRSDTRATAHTAIKIAGPSFSSPGWIPDAKALLDAGAPLDIITLHSYAVPADELQANLAEWRAIAGRRPVHCNEFSPFADNESEPTALTPAQTQQEVLDARTCALAFLRTGVVSFPHALLQRSNKPGDWRGAGYKWSSFDGAPFVPKEWCREFLSVMKFGPPPAQPATTP